MRLHHGDQQTGDSKIIQHAVHNTHGGSITAKYEETDYIGSSPIYESISHTNYQPCPEAVDVIKKQL